MFLTCCTVSVCGTGSKVQRLRSRLVRRGTNVAPYAECNVCACLLLCDVGRIQCPVPGECNVFELSHGICTSMWHHTPSAMFAHSVGSVRGTNVGPYAECNACGCMLVRDAGRIHCSVPEECNAFVLLRGF